MQAIAQALNSGFSQRQVSVIYRDRNQYRVVLEIEPRCSNTPNRWTTYGCPAPAACRCRSRPWSPPRQETAQIFITHRGQLPAATIGFTLGPGMSIGEATAAVERAAAEIGLPDSMRTEFAGGARAFQSFTRSQPLLILAALLTIYIVLGVLYEHLLHPITILSTLPTAGIGALLALRIFGLDFSVIALVGVILLMGIVKKNGIMMVDFALEHERSQGLGAEAAILEACRERFRPILMTTLAAVFGAVPLLLENGAGSELRHPLGVSVIGGLLLSQVITLYTTPVIYLAMDGLRGGAPRARPPAGRGGIAMSISAPFIRRPIGTALLAIGIALAGIVAYFALPVAPLPSVDLPTIVVGASQPGADPATMASSVAAPLERRLGAIAGVSEMTSTSSLGTTSIVVQFDLSRSVEGAARDVQAAINAARQRPAGRPAQPALLPQGQSRRRAGADHVDGVRHGDAGRGLRRRRQRRLAPHRPGARRLPGDHRRCRAAGHPRHHRPGRGQGGGRRVGSDPPGDQPEQRHPGDRADRRP